MIPPLTQSLGPMKSTSSLVINKCFDPLQFVSTSFILLIIDGIKILTFFSAELGARYGPITPHILRHSCRRVM